MKRLTEQQVMEYLAGELTPADKTRYEAHLAQSAEDAEQIGELQFALSALREWDESEPLRVSQNFWPQLRDQLGPPPQRSAWSKLRNQFLGLAGSPSRTRLSVGVAVATVVVAMGAFLFSPTHSTNQAQATPLTAADTAFVQSSVAQHADYVRHPLHPGDEAAYETGADENDSNPLPGE